MTALDMFHFEYGKDEICPMTKLPRSCPKEYGYLADAEWCSEGVNNEDCKRCWARELKDPFIAVQLPNYTPVDERKGYCDLGAFRLVIEDGNAVGVYCPGGLEADPATTPGGFLVKTPVVDEMSAYPVDFADAICKATDRLNLSLGAVLRAMVEAAVQRSGGEDVG